MELRLQPDKVVREGLCGTLRRFYERRVVDRMRRRQLRNTVGEEQQGSVALSDGPLRPGRWSPVCVRPGLRQEIRDRSHARGGSLGALLQGPEVGEEEAHHAEDGLARV